MRDLLPDNQIDIWRIYLSAGRDEIQYCRHLLSQDEVQRAERFYFEKHQRRFTVARACMRQILGEYAGVAPQQLVFSYGTKGKPELAGGLAESGIQFNLSHSSEIALLAVARNLRLGVDIERVNPEFATEEVAERFFSAHEVSTLRALHRGERPEAFFACWTRKEAYIKALGEGLSVPLDSFVVTLRPRETAALLQVTVDPAEVSRWSLYDLEAAEGYKAALVAQGKKHRLQASWSSTASVFRTTAILPQFRKGGFCVEY